ncbi:MEDS domain-containing protein [Blastococcus sp. TF02-8]|uniref:MEDS domain-containing protein n=1 Tax=Blastococcus sp. TF02-8 TaxID=2250574 RepID=UPI000DEB02CA|nr:MEDS domain-containing protein [Blastococcus sp. TF02-8]
MRGHGLVGEVAGAEAHDHVCWVYRDDAELHAVGTRFLAGGLARGERLLCVGVDLVEHLGLDDVDRLVAAGTLVVLTPDEAYVGAGGFTAEKQRAFYDTASRRARTDGYTGLRVLAELSSLAGDPGHARELARWEHHADQFIGSDAGMSAMCAYRADASPAAVTDIAAVHPAVHAPDGAVPFRVFFDRGRLALSGDVDTLGADRLARILDVSPIPAGTRSLDLSELDFADVAACRVLAAWARAAAQDGGRVQLWNATALLRRMWPAMGLDAWAPVQFAAAA